MTFTELYPTLRTLLGDTRTTSLYTDATLDMVIRVALLKLKADNAGYAYSESPTSSVSPAFAARSDELRLLLHAAILMLAPNSGAMSYRTPVLSVSRENMNAGHLGFLRQLLGDLDSGGAVAVDGYTDWEMYFEGSTRVADTLAELSAG